MILSFRRMSALRVAVVPGQALRECLDRRGRQDQEADHAEAMRRTVRGLSRLAGVNDLITRAVSGHSDVAIQELCITIRGEEMRKSLAAVVQVVGLGS